MFELTGRIKDLVMDFATGKAVISLEINEKEDIKTAFDELRGFEKLKISLERFRKKRSNDANKYFWVLCGKLACKIKAPKDDIYKRLIREIGDNFDIVDVKDEAVEAFVSRWQHGRLGWVCDILGKSEKQGVTSVCCYYGSSTYNSKQMSDLIDLIVFECKEQGIQTETPEEIARLKSLWGEAQ